VSRWKLYFFAFILCAFFTDGKNMRRVSVRRSPVHGKGLFAIHQLRAGERVLEYKGKVTSRRNALRRHRRDGIAGRTFLFGLSDGRVIDGSRGGNSARWINHACAPNCKAVEDGGRIFIDALDTIAAGQELFIDYLLTVGDLLDEDVRRQYACQCRAASCRGSMIASVAWVE
jgi:uncharacterized protein